MTPGQAGQHSMRLTGHGRVMKATPPSFGALTTAWAALGQKSFVKIAMPTLATCLMMDQTQQDSASASTVLPSHLKPEKTTNLMRMSETDGLNQNIKKKTGPV